jgi:hypothetical protein
MADLVADPVAAAKRVYAHAGEALSPAAERAMRAYLAENRATGRAGRHAYDAADFGLDANDLAAAFPAYRAAAFV